jgi:hypothetical protein
MYINGEHSARTMLLDVFNRGEGIWNSSYGAFLGAKYCFQTKSIDYN